MKVMSVRDSTNSNHMNGQTNSIFGTTKAENKEFSHFGRIIRFFSRLRFINFFGEVSSDGLETWRASPGRFPTDGDVQMDFGPNLQISVKCRVFRECQNTFRLLRNPQK